MIADRSRRSRPPEQVRGVADVEQGLGGAWGGANDLHTQALLALKVLDSLNVVAVAGDQYVGIRAFGEAHHINDYPDVPVAFVGDRLLTFGGEGLVHDERLGAHFVAELIEVID